MGKVYHPKEPKREESKMAILKEKIKKELLEENLCETCIHWHGDKCDMSKCVYEPKVEMDMQKAPDNTIGKVVHKERRKWDGEGTVMRQMADHIAVSMDSPPKMMKDDNEKLRWDLLPFEVIEEIVKVLTYGAKKYEPNNWKKGNTKRDIERTFAALMRHLCAWRKGEMLADDSQLHHLSHAFCDLMFLIYHEVNHKQERDIENLFINNWD